MKPKFRSILLKTICFLAAEVSEQLVAGSVPVTGQKNELLYPEKSFSRCQGMNSVLVALSAVETCFVMRWRKNFYVYNSCRKTAARLQANFLESC